jgi:hypothetical protein
VACCVLGQRAWLAAILEKEMPAAGCTSATPAVTPGNEGREEFSLPALACCPWVTPGIAYGNGGGDFSVLAPPCVRDFGWLSGEEALVGRQPLPAVRDFTPDGRWSTYDVSVCKKMGENMRRDRLPSKAIPSPTNLAQLGHFPPVSHAGRLAGPEFYVYVFSLGAPSFWEVGRRMPRHEQKRMGAILVNSMQRHLFRNARILRHNKH